MIGRKLGTSIRLTLSYIFLAIAAICSLYPALWVIFASVRPGKSLYSKSFFPSKITFEHYKELFTSKSFDFGHWYWNTLQIATVSMILGTTLVLLCGYALSRFRFRGRKTYLSVILVLGIFPGFMSMIALFILLKQLNLLDTPFALIFVYAFGAPLIGTFIVKGFFDTIPRSLDEAARIDGASNMKVFTRIIFPLSKPMLTYVALTQFVGPWIDYIFASFILRSRDKWTVAVGLYSQVSSNQDQNFTLFAAASVLIAVPITLLFMYLQRFLVNGITSGASKG
ncbi:MAG: sugar transporter permease [Bacilli bacterium]|jgi:arabinogalactan oligomer/maltooligosaccharide transport system permease protein|nr:sugar transporter permease [Bacilli bacterium]